MKPAIRVENLSKQYRIGARQDGYTTLRESLTRAATAPLRRLRGMANRNGHSSPSAATEEADTIWALKDVSFDVQPGEVVGIIGRNGAGKSTLLKVLSRITEPTSGRITLHGRVASLLEVGTGFHPELTGRENIYLNGAILGMSRREIAVQFDNIVEFSEVTAFIDTPVKRYSSGMYVRLAFAVASHLQPEILVVDEVLAVGDNAFQKKCMGRMQEVRQSGTTVLFVSHNMGAVSSLCQSAVWVESGVIRSAGPCDQVIAAYGRSMWDSSASLDLSARLNTRQGKLPTFVSADIIDASGVPTRQVDSGDPLSLRIVLHSPPETAPLNIRVTCEDSLGTELFSVGTHLSDAGPLCVDDRTSILCVTENLPLPAGLYTLTLRCGTRTQQALDVVRSAVTFEVLASDYYGNGTFPKASYGRMLMRSEWMAYCAGD